MTTKRGMPAHIQAALIADGTMTEQHVTRTARPRHCPACGLLVLAAIDDLGMDVRADPRPVTPYGELQAHMTGRRTWHLIQGGLDARDAPFIRYASADTLNIYAEHKCGTPPIEYRPEKKPAETPTTNTSQQIPF